MTFDQDNITRKLYGKECRPKNSFCDLSEYCNGTSHYCPSDVFIQNGYPCSSGSAYCFDGVCQMFDSQCQDLFDSEARKAPDSCFQLANMKGDRFGNCGMNGNNFIKCEQVNALCGKLQCTNVNMKSPPYGASISLTNINGTVCVNADFNLGTDVPDPAHVKKGTSCGKGKVCLDSKCVNASELGYDCDVQTKCNGHGVCNSNKNCHCDPGWAPPSCATPGDGGSIDSGPTRIDTSLRDGLLIFFLLVVPVLAFICFILYYKRNAIKKILRKRKQGQYRSDPTRQQAQVNSSNQNNPRNRQAVPIDKATAPSVLNASPRGPPVPPRINFPLPTAKPDKPPVPPRPSRVISH
nr:PREDICTED: disintegrin and metalloproteinase domain-containing protein 9-like [Latimeria chalumnae]|eukprot:XP_006001807.2 PREDICTED: disintegrin and metalloproteinase domain-containing protein 9-like [Latimeria chalumnae]